MGRLLIVSNRLPVTAKLDHGQVVFSNSAGGLATGLLGPHEKSDSVWFGWPGDVSRFDASQRSTLERELRRQRAMPVHLTQAEISHFYEGFSNGVLWPLFHYQTDKVQRDAWQNWKTYLEVNERFARLVAQNYRLGDVIWVHDYQLLLVPGMLRRLLPRARIGFFLHIPFPSSEVFRILPWRTEVLEGMLGADLIGFHTYSYLSHFSRAALHVMGEESVGQQLQYGGREIRLGAFPMGIDVAEFSRLADEPSVLAEVETLREQSGERKLLLGVDRLDYTKGLTRRMLAIERLFERDPSWRRRVRLVQIVVPSRTKVKSYEELRRQLDEIVGRINGAHGTVNSVPINYLYRSVPRSQLVALYRAADAMIVTPLRDGMNLVAKEFVACRNDEDGVLVLSEFAGAAAELAEALTVNPYDIDRVATAIKEALTMPEEERRARMRVMRNRIRSYDSYRWTDTFIEALRSANQPASGMSAVSRPEDITELLDRIYAHPDVTLLLDYDGTLVPFADTPQLAAPDRELKTLLRALADRPNIVVHVLSGRTRETLDRWLGDLPIALHAEHGYWSREPGMQWRAASASPPDWKRQVVGTLERFTEATPGSLIEEKTAGLAWHYRRADPVFGPLHAKELLFRLERELSGLPVELLPGEKVVEVRQRGINKGAIVSQVLGGEPSNTVALAMGDDRTDEDMFAALPEGSFSVHVGPKPSRSQYRLADPAEARTFLRRLLEQSGRTTPLRKPAAKQ
jgi:trehalose 6-phosphate synthase/phosphatase